MLALVLSCFVALFICAPRPGTAQSVGVPLIVILYDKHCKAYCGQVRPILQELKQQYPSIEFVELDISKDVLQESKAKAKALGRSVLQLVMEWGDSVPFVGFFNSKGTRVEAIPGPKTKEVYAKLIEKKLVNEK